MTDSELPTAAKINGTGQCVKSRSWVLKFGDELVRREDVAQLIEEKLDFIYEEDHDASHDQERAVIEILNELLEAVQSENNSKKNGEDY